MHNGESLFDAIDRSGKGQIEAYQLEEALSRLDIQRSQIEALLVQVHAGCAGSISKDHLLESLSLRSKPHDDDKPEERSPKGSPAVAQEGNAPSDDDASDASSDDDASHAAADDTETAAGPELDGILQRRRKLSDAPGHVFES